jgi:Tfp pilus assembly protein FimT
VVITIVAVISVLVLARYGQFNGQVLLRNLAYDIALSVRQAQVYTISGKAGSTTNGVQYGVYFRKVSTITQYTLFGDNNGNGAYDAGEEVEVLTVRSGYSIKDFCGDPASGVSDCANGVATTAYPSVNSSLSSMTIMFKRPDPDAYIKVVGTAPLATGYKQARIIARSPTGDTRTITISITGQIAIEQGIN